MLGSFVTLDVGLDTGYCHFENNRFKYSETINFREKESISRLSYLLLTSRPQFIVCEFPSYIYNGELQKQLLEISNTVRLLAKSTPIHEVNPGQWKPLKNILRLPKNLPYKMDAHQQDAFRIGLYWMRNHKDYPNK